MVGSSAKYRIWLSHLALHRKQAMFCGNKAWAHRELDHVEPGREVHVERGQDLLRPERRAGLKGKSREVPEEELQGKQARR